MLFTSKSPLFPFIFDSTPIFSYNYRLSSAALRQNGEKTRNRGALSVGALGRKVGSSLLKNLCQHNSNMADVGALVAPSDAILSPPFHMLFLYRSA